MRRVRFADAVARVNNQGADGPALLRATESGNRGSRAMVSLLMA